MSIEIWTGAVLGTRRRLLIERCADLVSSGRAGEFLYIAASHPLLDQVTGAILDGSRNSGVWGDLPVHLFRGFVRHILRTAVDEEGALLTPRQSVDDDSLPVRRALVSRVVRQLVDSGEVTALAPLSRRDGCIASIASLIGEIERAGKTASEFEEVVQARGLADRESSPPPDDRLSVARQTDIDREIAAVYSGYARALDRFHLTEDDADQLRALEILRGEINGVAVLVPWLSRVRLLVLDGFFDFTPVQGEMLRLLVPGIPETIVNINADPANPEIFSPFAETIEHLSSMGETTIVAATDTAARAGALSLLPQRLFNTMPANGPAEADHGPSIRILECGDRETEIRAIAREVKRLTLIEGHDLADIGVVVRERTSYEAAIARIFSDEGIPCALAGKISLDEIPCVRAAMKLLQALAESPSGRHGRLSMSVVGDLIKTGYFQPDPGELRALRAKFELENPFTASRPGHSSRGAGTWLWDIDEIENVIAYVGSDLNTADWLRRAGSLAERADERPEAAVADPAMREERDEDEDDDGADSARDRGEQGETEGETGGKGRRKARAPEVPRDVLKWVRILVQRFAEMIEAAPAAGSPRELRFALMRILSELTFADSIVQPLAMGFEKTESTRMSRDLGGLDGIRRAFSAALKSIEISRTIAGKPAAEELRLVDFIDEALRCIRSITLVVDPGDPAGLQVLEATDVRGLRFRALFVAGLVEGGFPLRTARDWIYPQDERERLKRFGVTLEDISPATLLKEEHYFYQVVCRATERLYLTRPLTLEGGLETVASYYIDEVRKAVEPAAPDTETTRRDLDGLDPNSASTRGELAYLLVRLDEREAAAPLIEWSLEEGIISASAIERVRIERQRAGRRFGRYDGRLANSTLIQLIRDRFGEEAVFSASALSLYGKCPYRFFVERILNLKPRGEAALDLSALDSGMLLHEVLRRFLGKYRGRSLGECDAESLFSELDSTADEVFDQHERLVPPLSRGIWNIDRENRKLILRQVLEFELSLQRQTSSHGMRPAFLELAFGMSSDEDDPASTPEYLPLERSATGETLRFRGRIDRVDMARDGTAVAYDYKLSTAPKLADMQSGRDLQMGLYIAALEWLLPPDSRIAGGGYYLLKARRKDRRVGGFYRSALAEYTGIESRLNLDDEEWTRLREQMQTKIFEFVEGIRDGKFRVTPSRGKKTCAICDFGPVCRYDTFRIRGKLMEERGE